MVARSGGVATLSRRAGTRHVANIAHRGASHEAPENTMAAIRRAIALDADAVEIDVQRTKDGALVLLHDTSLVRTTDARRIFPRRSPWHLADFTHDEVCRLAAGAWSNGGEQVPMLSEAMELLASHGTSLLLEVKTPSLYPGITTDVADALASAPPWKDNDNPVVVQSFQVAAMKELKARMPSISVGLLGSPSREHLPVLATWADQVNPHHLLVDAAYVDVVRQCGMACMLWTVDRPQTMRRAIRLGADGIITNRPDLLADVSAATEN